MPTLSALWWLRDLQHLNYAGQVQYKAERVRELAREQAEVAQSGQFPLSVSLGIIVAKRASVCATVQKTAVVNIVGFREAASSHLNQH